MIADVTDTLDRGERPSVRQHTLIRLALTNVTASLHDVGNFVYLAGGTTALRRGTIQRLLRDVHAGTQHVTSSPPVWQTCGRELAGLAYERELSAELTKLREQFDAWDAGQMTPFELEQAIHQFHDGVSRQLYNRYSSGSTLPHAVAAAIMNGTISVAEIPEPARTTRTFSPQELS